jgi:F-type H+-transporting ATPase subunit b
MRGRYFALTIVCALGAAPALAAGGGEGISVSDLLYRLLNLVLLLGVLIYFARKPIMDFFAERRGRIQEELTSAAEMRSEAEQRYASWQRRVADVESELDSIRATARERAERERDQILAAAQAAAERIKSDARAAIDQEVRRASAQLRDEASDLAVELAAEMLREQVTSSDRDRLLEEFIQRIERTDSAGNGR